MQCVACPQSLRASGTAPPVSAGPFLWHQVFSGGLRAPGGGGEVLLQEQAGAQGGVALPRVC